MSSPAMARIVPVKQQTPADLNQQFILLCGNDNFSQWFYQDIMTRCRIDV